MKIVVFAAALVAAALAPSVSASSPRSGDLQRHEGVLGIHGRGRFLLHDHVVEPRCDRGRLEDHLSPAGRPLDACRQRRRPRPSGAGQQRRVRQLLARCRTLHVLGRDREVRLVPCQCRCVVSGRPQLGLGRDVQLQPEGLKLYIAAGGEGGREEERRARPLTRPPRRRALLRRARSAPAPPRR